MGKENSQGLMTNLGKVRQNIIVRDYSQVLSYGYLGGRIKKKKFALDILCSKCPLVTQV